MNARSRDTVRMANDDSPVELIGVYNADGGLVGELAYVLSRARGTAHCALCDITHGTIRRKPEWNQACLSFPIPIRLIHLNERTPQEVSACILGTPTVLARNSDGSIEAILGPADLELNGSVDVFFARLTSTLDRQ